MVSLQGSLQRGPTPQSAPNPNTHILAASTVRRKEFMSHDNTVSLQGLLQRGQTPPSTPNPGTHIPLSTIGQKAFVSHDNMDS